MIRTIGELKKVIANIDDDFTIDVRIIKELSEEELSGSNYPYPYEYSKASLEIGDIGYSDKDVFINVEEISDDVCEWRIVDRPNNLPIYNTSCGKIRLQYATGVDIYCNGCGKKIKVVE